MYYVYVLKSLKLDYFYKGMTKNLDLRIDQHFKGESYTTKKYLPLELVFVQICELRKEAKYLEKYLKSGYGREVLREILDLGKPKNN